MKLGEAIKSIRVKAGLTPKEVYTRAQLTQGFYSGLEVGVNKPSLDTLQRISDAVGVPVFFIMFCATDRRELTRKDRIWYDNLYPVIDALVAELTTKNAKKYT
jgi:transcriptional regulator with XRE-family HTH domain